MQAVHVERSGGRQSAIDALAHHGPLLARNGFQVGVVAAGDGAAERHVQRIAALPGGGVQFFGGGFSQKAQFGGAGAEAAAEIGGMLGEGGGGRGIVGEHAAIDTEGQADERVAEEAGFYLGQGQHAGDGAVLFGDQVVGLVIEGAGNDVAPGGLVEEGGGRVGVDVAVPAGGVGA